MNPRIEAAAFRIWQHCQEHGWDFYPKQLAADLDIPLRRVLVVIREKGWKGRLPTTGADATGAWDMDSKSRVPEVGGDPQEVVL